MLGTLPRALAAALVLGFAAPALGALVTGNVEGRVTDETTGKPLPGVTVSVSGPALQGEQTEFTDKTGHYLITELPPGEYVVRFYYGNVEVERPRVVVDTDRTLSVSVALPAQRVRTQTIVISERAPSVDVATTQLQTLVTDDLVRNVPLRSRTVDSTLTLAPGSAADPIGASFNGATGLENNYLLDGLNTTNVTHGLIGNHLSVEFVKQTELITGGYNAEYGRALGGVVNVVTKQGSDEFHGGVWFQYAPFELDPMKVARAGEAIASVPRGGPTGYAYGSLENFDHAVDFGFDLGGPIVKHRIWFYAGLAPTFLSQTYDRILRARTASTAAEAAQGGQYDPSATCPSSLADPALCPPAGEKTTELALPGRSPQRIHSDSRLYNAIAKLDFRINDDNHLTLEYVASPSTFSGAFNNPFGGVFGIRPLGSINGDPAAFPFDQTAQVHDVVGHFLSKLLGKRLQLDALAGYHYESYETTPSDFGAQNPQVRDTRTMSLADFEPDVTPCARTMVGGVSFNPCPVTNYLDGGFGEVNQISAQRGIVSLAATYFLKLGGTHALKLGADFEGEAYSNHFYFTGGDSGGFYKIKTNGQIQRLQTATAGPDGLPMLVPGGFTSTSTEYNESVYLRDSWDVSFVPGLTLNAGLRWEGQQLQDKTGKTQIDILDNLAPRLGFAYDFTHKGRSKLYASYGRFYESIPLDLADREFNGSGIAVQSHPIPGTCASSDAMGNPVRVNAANCQYGPIDPKNPFTGVLVAGSVAPVTPHLQGQYTNEIVAGLQYDVGWDTVLGAAYVHRDLGRIIEDVSPDGGNTYVVTNPGQAVDQGAVADVQAQINDINSRLKAQTDPNTIASLSQQKAQLQQQLQGYQYAATFSPPKRDYNALVLTAEKRFSHNFLLLASYTYSRTIGNYGGLYDATTGQVDPNATSQYDAPELSANTNGPLPTDRPHNFKVAGAYYLPTGTQGGFTFGVNFNVLSGTPIDVLGSHPVFGRMQTFILPRGSGGRTPTLTALDLHLAYTRRFSSQLRADLTWDVFNVLDQQQPILVDQEYTVDDVQAIVNGKPSDLRNLHSLSGQPVHVNPNYGNGILFQSPLSMRFGARISF